MKLVHESLEGYLNEKLDPNAKIRNRGDVVLSANSKFVKDHADHFPLNSIEQARNALARVKQYDSSPGWYEGDLESLIKKVRSAVERKYPSIEISENLNEMEGGKGENLDPDDVCPDQLEVGIAVEMEHTNDPDISKQIALDHLSEIDDYYTKLVQAGLVDEPEAIELYNKLLK